MQMTLTCFRPSMEQLKHCKQHPYMGCKQTCEASKVLFLWFQLLGFYLVHICPSVSLSVCLSTTITKNDGFRPRKHLLFHSVNYPDWEW